MLLAKELELRQELMSMVIAMRKAQHLSQQELAEKLNVSQARVSQMERGREPLSVDSLLQMIKALHGSIVILTPEEVKNYGLQEKVVAKGDLFRKALDMRAKARGRAQKAMPAKAGAKVK
ncbi:MAG: helix-turn-helix domain-containing protein [Armatimonadetes bacterium]|nr:helix-turn-helix domain-containing protein [Armatimonadota bacterium]